MYKISRAMRTVIFKSFPVLPDTINHNTLFTARSLRGKYHVSLKDAQHLSAIFSYWYRRAGELGLRKEITDRLQTCTRVYSAARVYKGELRKRCHITKICPWCRAKMYFVVMKNFTEAVKDLPLFGTFKYSPCSTTKAAQTWVRPKYAVGALRNFVYEPEQRSLSFSTCYFSPSAEDQTSVLMVDNELIQTLDEFILWNQLMVENVPVFHNYLTLTKGLRLYSSIKLDGVKSVS